MRERKKNLKNTPRECVTYEVEYLTQLRFDWSRELQEYKDCDNLFRHVKAGSSCDNCHYGFCADVLFSFFDVLGRPSEYCPRAGVRVWTQDTAAQF